MNHISHVGPVWLGNVGCSSDDEILDDCYIGPWGISYCGHYEDVGVICQPGKSVCGLCMCMLLLRISQCEYFFVLSGNLPPVRDLTVTSIGSSSISISWTVSCEVWIAIIPSIINRLQFSSVITHFQAAPLLIGLRFPTATALDHDGWLPFPVVWLSTLWPTFCLNRITPYHSVLNYGTRIVQHIFMAITQTKSVQELWKQVTHLERTKIPENITLLYMLICLHNTLPHISSTQCSTITVSHRSNQWNSNRSTVGTTCNLSAQRNHSWLQAVCPDWWQLSQHVQHHK